MTKAELNWTFLAALITHPSLFAYLDLRRSRWTKCSSTGLLWQCSKQPLRWTALAAFNTVCFAHLSLVCISTWGSPVGLDGTPLAILEAFNTNLPLCLFCVSRPKLCSSWFYCESPRLFHLLCRVAVFWYSPYSIKFSCYHAYSNLHCDRSDAPCHKTCTGRSLAAQSERCVHSY